MTEPVVKKPAFRDGEWCVIIQDGHSFFAEELEVIKCSSREAAYQIYRQIKKESGEGL